MAVFKFRCLILIVFISFLILLYTTNVIVNHLFFSHFLSFFMLSVIESMSHTLNIYETQYKIVLEEYNMH